MKKNIKRILLYVIASIVVVFLVIWGAALIKCEILTHKYYDEFKLVYQNNTMISDMKWFKVLNCMETRQKFIMFQTYVAMFLSSQIEKATGSKRNGEPFGRKEGALQISYGHIGGKFLLPVYNSYFDI